MRDDAVALIATLTSVESWEQFRQTYGRSSLQTRRAWAQAMGEILKGGREEPPCAEREFDDFLTPSTLGYTSRCDVIQVHGVRIFGCGTLAR